MENIDAKLKVTRSIKGNMQNLFYLFFFSDQKCFFEMMFVLICGFLRDVVCSQTGFIDHVACAQTCFFEIMFVLMRVSLRCGLCWNRVFSFSRFAVLFGCWFVIRAKKPAWVQTTSQRNLFEHRQHLRETCLSTNISKKPLWAHTGFSKMLFVLKWGLSVLKHNSFWDVVYALQGFFEMLFVPKRFF